MPVAIESLAADTRPWRYGELLIHAHNARAADVCAEADGCGRAGCCMLAHALQKGDAKEGHDTGDVVQGRTRQRERGRRAVAANCVSGLEKLRRGCRNGRWPIRRLIKPSLPHAPCMVMIDGTCVRGSSCEARGEGSLSTWLELTEPRATLAPSSISTKTCRRTSSVSDPHLAIFPSTRAWTQAELTPLLDGSGIRARKRERDRCPCARASTF